MRRNAKWIIATVFVVWYGWAGFISMGGSLERLHPRPAAAPAPSTTATDWVKYVYDASPAMRQEVAKQVGLIAYPQTVLHMADWRGDPNVPASALLASNDPTAEVLEFYRTQYAAQRPLVRVSQPPFGGATLLLSSQADAAYAVMVRPGDTTPRPPRPHGYSGFAERRTMISLARTPFPMKLAAGSPLPWATPNQLPPHKLGLRLPAGATVDYCGWARGERGPIAMAQAEVNLPAEKVFAFYRGFVRSGHSSSQGSRGEASWHGEDGRYEVTLRQMDKSLPVVIILQHRGGRWWEIVGRRMSLLPRDDG